MRNLAVIGLSMGGRSAYTFAARRPDLVRALVIVDTGPVGMATGGRRIRSFVQLPDERDSYEDFVTSVHEYQPLRSIEQIRDTLKFNVRQLPDGKWTWKYDRILRDPGFKRPAPPPEEGWAHLRQIRCPTLLIRGDQSDVLAHEIALEMVNTIKECTYRVVDRAGHIVPGDNPAGFVAALRPWLTASYLSINPFP
jgi:pimeloyl-ACP methyl ester carboxylesterase